ncbi:glycoside hydrolase family 10 protein [Entomospira culicis]|uniref:Family 10 glycosylhydrolase n=1 Tax=Entomospira culicis TaxID=2719989 RepID=A0A968GHA5_9SPIO|nr:family 10 glycosylhydrolase [Entomospira culicis]NIZ18802.1 family 10 glycosylhydrolase [Entomospira culicis]NIZ69017.1 family 10 glycosylhydrolase [Entomospira culicis]WDI37607.1 family 10 glycosylhydrolase [Entomospira culicis]WDI39235.1 family 10 glycosylhydrolase [Entomospira culicis]
MYIRRNSKSKRISLLLAILMLTSCPQAKQEQPQATQMLHTFLGVDSHYNLLFSDQPIKVVTTEPTEHILVVKEYVEPHEMARAVWIGTISQLHYPRKNADGTPRLSLAELQSDWLEILANAQFLHLNMIIFQVSPMLDAFYTSEHRPWSQFLNAENRQGIKPEWADSFDLVAWMIEQTHQRGMEFHAWFNPYRVTAGGHYTISLGSDGTLEGELSVLPAGNFAKDNPNTTYLFDKKVYLDPGLDTTINHIEAVIAEFLERYDADAIHFDDYFYPYSIFANGERVHFADQLLDRETFRNNRRGFTFIEDIEGEADLARYQQEVAKWRNDNNDRMVLRVKAVIDAHNAERGKAVQWGISPFGIWAHYDENPLGSKTPVGSTASYRDIYADTLKWAKEEHIDYIIPQVYWNFETKAAPYSTITYWWQDALKDASTHLYIGHANYKTGVAWNNYSDIANQLRYNARFPKIQGSAFFSYNDLLWQIPNNTARAVRNLELITLRDHLRKTSLIPAKPWLDRKETLPLTFIHYEPSEHRLSFHDSLLNDTRFYVIYGLNGEQREILQVVGRDKKIAKQAFTLNPLDLHGYTQLGISIKDFSGVENTMQIINLPQL